jgi:hypothetical protein
MGKWEGRIVGMIWSVFGLLLLILAAAALYYPMPESNLIAVSCGVLGIVLLATGLVIFIRPRLKR